MPAAARNSNRQFPMPGQALRRPGSFPPVIRGGAKFAPASPAPRASDAPAPSPRYHPPMPAPHRRLLPTILPALSLLLLLTTAAITVRSFLVRDRFDRSHWRILEWDGG